MPQFYLVTNPLQPLKDCAIHETADETIAQFISREGVDMSGRICLLDNMPVEAPQFGDAIHKDAIVIVCPDVGYVGVVLLLVSIAIAAAMYFLIDIPQGATAGDTNLPEADPAYTLRGQRNQARLSAVIEKNYGRTRRWPSYMSRPYNQFVGNDQYLYALLCVGLGEYDVEAVRIDDTALSGFADVTYEVYPPGEPVTLFPTNVQTSGEVGGIELYGPNEREYTGWHGPFVACAAGSRAYTIEIDVACRQGLYVLDSMNTPTAATVSITAEYRAIDDAGDPLGGWATLTTFTPVAASNKPQRWTLSIPVSAGRYEVRVARSTNKDDSYKIRHTIHWESLRAFCEASQDFGDTTLLAIRAKATNNLNDGSKTGFNVISTSKLPVYDSGTGLWTLTTTANPVWVALDILRAGYGRRLSADTIDMPAFCALAEELDAEGITFNGSFDQRVTVWEALVSVLSIARAKPVVPAGLISVVRDRPVTTPTLGFNCNNIGKDSFTMRSTLTKIADTDGIEVEYIDGVTWKRRTVTCLLGRDRGVNLRSVRLLGCTDRNLAYRWGMYQRAVELYQTENIVFETGIEGGTAVYGDLIAVKHELIPTDEVVSVSATGRLSYGAFGETVDELTTIQLPVAPVFLLGETHRISFRNKLGAIRGPFICTAVPGDDTKVALAVRLNLTDTLVPEDSEQPLYWFGISGYEYALYRIVKLEPSGTHKMRVTAVPYDSRIYAYDSATAPLTDTGISLPEDPDAPALLGLEVEPIYGDPTRITLTWIPSLGAKYYVIQQSMDGTVYDTVTQLTETSYVLTVFPGNLWLKVYAVNKGAGTPATWAGEVGTATTAPDPVTGLTEAEPFVGDALSLEWDADPLARRYRVRYYLGATLIATATTNTNSILYPSAYANADATAAAVDISPAVTVDVRGENSMGDGAYCSPEVFTNTAPAAPTSIIVGALTSGEYPISWTHGLEADLLECRVYASATNGFTPGAGNLVDTVPAPGYTSSVPSALRYCIVGAVDKWGNAVALSGQVALW